MLIRPRKNLYKSFQKQRSVKKSHVHTKQNFYFPKKVLVYGQYGLKTYVHDIQIFNKHLFRLKLFLKKSVRKSSITNRILWIKSFPHIPVTKKVIGSRMGKGKGKVCGWAAKIPSRSIFIELRNVRRGRMNYFFKQIKYKLPGKYVIITRFNQKNTIKLYPSTHIQYVNFH